MEIARKFFFSRPITWRHARWSSVTRQTNPYMLKAGYDIVLRREATRSLLQKGGGQMVSGIDAKSIEVLEKYPRIIKTLSQVKLEQVAK